MAGRATALIRWSRRERRPLPWRGERDPYRVLVSEVMLQQTQADRVAPRYERFLARFPTVEALAAASLADVLEEWSGLGYNRRARHLRAAAQVVAASGWPATAAELESLPGVGPYTAAAIACFAFGEQVPALDVNVRRVLSRWHGAPLTGRALAAVAAAELGGDARDWNQAMMDLGAVVCTARRPRCDACPVAAGCPGPDGWAPGRPQGRFEGSTRQLRGGIVRALLGGPASREELVAGVGFDAERVDAALGDLAAEGMVEHSGRGWRLP